MVQRHKRKFGALTFMLLVSISGMISISINTYNPKAASNSRDFVAAEQSYVDVIRPPVLEAGKNMNYSFDFGPVIPPTDINPINSTNVTASIYYDVTAVDTQYYYLSESVTGLTVSYGGTNGNRTMGVYDMSLNRTGTVEPDITRGYSPESMINSSSSNETNFVTTYSYNTNLQFYKENKTLQGSSGDQVCATVVDSLLATSADRFNKVTYFGHFRTLLSYYKDLNIIALDPSSLYETNLSAIGFELAGEDDVSTIFGTRATVKFFRDLPGNKDESLFYDKYTGILVKSVLYIDTYPESGQFPTHVITITLQDTNVNFSTEIPKIENEFQDAIDEVVAYLKSSALNDTNRSLFFHSTIGDGSAVVDASKLSADNFKVLYGFESYNPGLLETLFLEINASTLHDTTNGTFYNSTFADVADGVTCVTDAAWAIIGSIQFGSLAYDFQQEMFDYMQTLYVNRTYHGFARSPDLINGSIFAYDNLISYIALQAIARSNHTNFTMISRASIMAENVIDLFYSTAGGDHFWDASPTSGLFYNSIEVGGGPAIDTKSLRDSALAIYALSDFYLNNRATVNEGMVDRANDTLSILLEKMWNGTDGGFIDLVNVNLNPQDGSRHLEGNSYMIIALLELLVAMNFKNSTTDLGCYNIAYDTWSFISTHLHDDVNGTFQATTNNEKSMSGDLGLLLVPLVKMRDYSRSVTFSTVANQTTYYFQNMTHGLIEGSANFKITRNFKSEPAISLTIPLNYSDVNFKILYDNGTEYAELFNVTNPDGEIQCYFEFPSIPEYGDHRSVASLNRTGFEPLSSVAQFTMASAIQIKEIKLEDFSSDTYPVAEGVEIPAVFQAENFSLMLNFSTEFIEENISVDVNVSSTALENKTFELNLTSATSNQTFSLNLTCLENATLGQNSFSLAILHEGYRTNLVSFNFFVKTPFFITNVNFSSYINHLSNYSLTLDVRNLNPNLNLSVSIVFESEYLESLTGDYEFDFPNIAPLDQSLLEIEYKLKDSVSFVLFYTFSLKISINDELVGGVQYSIEYRAPLEVTYISGPSKPVQNNPMYFTIVVENNNNHDITATYLIEEIKPNGRVKVLETLTDVLEPGENKYIYKLSQGFQSPWDFGEKEYKITVLLDGDEVGYRSIIADVQISLENAIIGYLSIFGFFGFVFLAVIYKKRQIESIKKS
ncbi:MAG: hypothetical protein ACTSUE_03365 [Promethearchaeota archaeon]